MLMLYFWSVRWLLLHFLLLQVHFQYASGIWSDSEASGIELLGLFGTINNETDLSSVHSCAMFKSAVILSQKLNITIEGQYIGYRAEQTNGDVVDALKDTCTSMSDGNIIGIVGPEYSREADIIAVVGEKVGIPVIS